MVNICIYGNPTIDEIWISGKLIATRIGGGVFYSSQPFLRNIHKYKIHIEAVLSPRNIELLAQPVYVYPHYSSRANHFKLIYNDNGREIIVIEKAPQLTNSYVPLNQCVSIVNPVLGEISISVLKTIRYKSKLLALDIQGFIRKEEDGRIVLYKNTEAYEAIKIADIVHLDLLEASIITGEPVEELEEIIRKLMALDIRYVVITRQYKDPILIMRDKYQVITYPGRKVFRAEDKTGAGDYFLASIVKHYLKCHNIEYVVMNALRETDEWLSSRKGLIAAYHPNHHR